MYMWADCLWLGLRRFFPLFRDQLWTTDRCQEWVS